MRTSFGVLGIACLTSLPAQAEQPLSAINWLSDSVTTPAGTVVAPDGTTVLEPDVTKSPVPDVVISVLDAPTLDTAGVLSSSITGLPKRLWGMGRTQDIAAMITAERADALPSLQALFITLLLAEADAPPDSDGSGVLLLARIDKLLAIGALDQAAELIAAAGEDTPELFRRNFDISLLLGAEDQACEKMQAVPELAPTFPARIFCLVRAGDWNAAALSLQTGKALGRISDSEDALLRRFLDDELADGAEPLPVPDAPSPLILRMYEAIGEPLLVQALPLAFQHTELESRSGWKAQLEAAEKLARAGAIAPNQLLGLYTQRKAAASGMVWDRVAAIQEFDAALQAHDPTRISRSLPLAWTRMAQAELEVPFAKMFAADLAKVKLEGAADALAFRIRLLSQDYEKAALSRQTTDAGEAFLVAIAKGRLEGVTPPDALSRAIAPAFLRPNPGEAAREMLEQGRIGEAVLYAIDRIGSGARGDLDEVTEGLAILRMLGMEDAARRAALELILLERRG
ncbi:hypothetical protein [Neogemmobacter tilapiae]|uniref:Uncharacterized protein n=1 Tax=Neogemmobacter tilapiae TaxID=875041 RepID=A0A918TEF2_9RHOB|nr:hypothetical protein [Gemmobacter tilapiae]GHC44470.1 hypothetical protein GCM10007315_02090 [Gemmobacter tilapiae]